MKKIVSIILTIIFVISIMPIGLFSIVSAETTNYIEGFYTYTVKNGEATITDCFTSISGDVTIPSTLGGYPVTSIGHHAFNNCTSLVNITIGHSVTSIGQSAFESCTSLTSISIPNSVTSIGYRTFSDCENLEDVWYGGSISEKESITIGSKNSCLTNATWHYNICDSNSHVYGGECDSSCNKCEWTRTVTRSHSYDNACDTQCNICGYLRSITHNYEWVIDKQETCGVSGQKHEECTVCHTKRNENTVISATGDHSYDNACDTQCNICGYLRSITHNYEWVIDKQATCGGSGLKHEECTVCHTKRNENTVISATENHTYDNECDTQCNVCEAIRTITHKYDNECDTDCNVCGYIRSAPHYFKWVIDKQETCGESGLKHEECTVCHTKRNENTVISATGNHNYEWVIDKQETCGESGLKHEECTICHAKRNENTAINATENHDYKWIIDQAENCGVNGIKHEECTICHAKRNENTTINATGNHAYDDSCDTECNVCKYTRSITHTYDSNSDSICNVCGHIRQYFTITYNGNGEVGTPVSQTLPEDISITLPNATSNYYQFLGWSKTPYGEVDYKKNSSYIVTENITLYAKWGGHCDTCDDSGAGQVICPQCGGTGRGNVSYCRICGGDGYISVFGTCTDCSGRGFHPIAQNKAPKPQLHNKTKTSVTLVKFEWVDYSKDGEIWQESNIFENLTPGKQYTFFMRYKANSVNTVGPKSDSLIVTMVTSEITSSKHKVSGNTISKIAVNTAVSALLVGLSGGEYCKVYKGNSVVSGNSKVGTGMVVKIMDGNIVKASYTAIVTGDTNGDGAISVTDMIAIKAHLLKKSTLSGAYATAADTSGDSGISITDFIQIKAKILGKGNIVAR